MIKFTTQHCAHCWVAKCVVTGCNPKRGAGERAKCSKCGSKLPPRGEIVGLRYLEVFNEEGERMASGYMMKVRRASDSKEEWYLVYARGGVGSRLFKHIGKNSNQVKKWLEDNKHTAKWPADPVLGSEPFVPFKK